MRTTVTREPDLTRNVKALAEPRYALTPHEGGFRPGINPGKLNQLIDQLETEDLLAEVARISCRPS